MCPFIKSYVATIELNALRSRELIEMFYENVPVSCIHLTCVKFVREIVMIEQLIVLAI